MITINISHDLSHGLSTETKTYNNFITANKEISEIPKKKRKRISNTLATVTISDYRMVVNNVYNEHVTSNTSEIHEMLNQAKKKLQNEYELI